MERGKKPHRGNTRGIGKFADDMLDKISEAQARFAKAQLAGETQQSRRETRHSVKRRITLRLENGNLFKGVAIDGGRERETALLSLESACGRVFRARIDAGICSVVAKNADALKSALNGYLNGLHAEAKLDFPEWLEKYGAFAGNANAAIGVSEIKTEWARKKAGFGEWRDLAAAGFYTDTRPLRAKSVKVARVEIGEIF